MGLNDNQWRKPRVGLGLGLVFLIVGVLVLFTGGPNDDGAQGWSGLAGLPLWIVAGALIVSGAFCTYTAIGQLIRTRR